MPLHLGVLVILVTMPAFLVSVASALLPDSGGAIFPSLVMGGGVAVVCIIRWLESFGF